MSLIPKFYPQVWKPRTHPWGRGGEGPVEARRIIAPPCWTLPRQWPCLGDLFGLVSARRTLPLYSPERNPGRSDSLPGPIREPRSREAHVPAQQPQEEEDPRLPHPYADAGRPADPGAAAQQGPGRAVGLTTADGKAAVGFASVVMSRAAHGMRSGDIRRVLSQGRRFTGRRVSVSVLALDVGLAAAFVSSRSVGGAVARNRARRLMREAWRALAERATGGHSVVVIARPEISGARLHDVVGDLEQVLARAGVIA